MRPPSRHYGALAQPLDDILGTTSRIRVLRALDRSIGPHAVSSLAKDTGLAHNAVAAAVAVLTRAGLVTETALGARQVYTLNALHPFVAPLIQLFAVERERRQAIRHAVEDWEGDVRSRPLAVWLFGSVARHEDTAESDVDLALVALDRRTADSLAASLRATLTRVAERYWLHPNVLAYDGAELRALPSSDPTMWKNLSRDAIALHGPMPAALRTQLERGTRTAPTDRRRKRTGRA